MTRIANGGSFRVLAGAIFLSVAALAQDPVQYGKYLVNEIGKCQDCHSPRNSEGKIDEARYMKGAVLDFAPLQPVKDWHKTSPDLTPSGRLWQRWGDEGMRKYLVTGLTPKGSPAGPPMPTYKLKPADAEAIVAYLKTLK